MAKKIEEPKAGTPVNQLWKTVRELVKVVNAMQNMKLSPQGIGELKISESNAKLIFNTEKCE
jgi:hypothetical protein